MNCAWLPCEDAGLDVSVVQVFSYEVVENTKEVHPEVNGLSRIKFFNYFWQNFNLQLLCENMAYVAKTIFLVKLI